MGVWFTKITDEILRRVVTTSRPDGVHDPFGARSPRDPRYATADVVEWIAVLEFGTADSDGRFSVAEVQSLVAALAGWDPSALWSPDRYAIQLRLPARSAEQALQWALACHRDAARTTRLPPTNVVRVEILTIEEYGHSGQPTELGAIPVAAHHDGLWCDELYGATRRLLAAATAGEVADTVIDFVVAVGGRVESGRARHLGDTIDIDLTVDDDGAAALYASAEAFSVAGLIIQWALPALLIDARLTVARLRRLERGRLRTATTTPDHGDH